jgi:MFS family permease
LDEKDSTKNNSPIALGLRQNIKQFSILILVNAFVGAMIGLEQTVVPIIGKNDFGIESNAIIVSFIASFGAVKAILNLFAGSLSDKWGRKNVFGFSVCQFLSFYCLQQIGTGLFLQTYSLESIKDWLGQ